jgi:hypothetical protein
MDNPTLLHSLRKHRQYRQIIDCWFEDRSIRILSGRFKISIEQATLISRIIDELSNANSARGSYLTTAYKTYIGTGNAL